ncbi:bZIP transcription factor 11-like [Zingiber officinale]|uniref:BZIP domain-containing protein n=1 Tax=Zingiber officinale TaxID=94328 RepID=A0A8J5I597_ZINOF|nr:bZIP transcription factor 11-like [Zingiber officinale]KAG6529147.1 hypothetical protein ZIOFF_011342 [Zingiber officinale]
MASPGGTSTCSEEGGLLAVVEQRKRKRMISNRESARRSRMRKQKHLDGLTAQSKQLSTEKEQLVTSLSLTQQQCAAVEAENCVLRAQGTELSRRLQALEEILCLVGSLGGGSPANLGGNFNSTSSWGSFMCMNQPIMAAAESLFYC